MSPAVWLFDISYFPSGCHLLKTHNKGAPGLTAKPNIQHEYFSLSDPNVDVIFVSPVNINEEMHQYYSKLLGLKSAVDSGNVDDQADPTDRYKIIMPDALKAFPVSLLVTIEFSNQGTLSIRCTCTPLIVCIPVVILL